MDFLSFSWNKVGEIIFSDKDDDDLDGGILIPDFKGI